jgi:hypothetical protein
LSRIQAPLITCEKCGRRGRYSVTRLVGRYGADAKLTNWLAAMTQDCPKRCSVDMSDQCGARCPDLVGLARNRSTVCYDAVR